MTRKQKRLAGIGFIAMVLAAAIGLVLVALRDEIVFFYTPTEIIEEKKAKAGQRFRLGGLVKEESLEKQGTMVKFVITDTNSDLNVRYTGILPDLFKEGQGVVAEGVLNAANTFVADSVLAKHDENYMPKEVTDSLKKQGYWQKTSDEESSSK
ncbi:MAG: cytochrome c maturation protein CcmE [Hyphomicrobiales bacterium]|nr:cytochrome c maturation protein CcmE [Hyphomicrobiales bacterium]